MTEILLVEDDANSRKAYAILLRNHNYTVDTAANGQVALEKLQNHAYDLVITDLKMIPVDGMTVLTEAKKLHPETEVLVITAYGTIESGVEAMKRGAYHYITKPFNNEEFLLLVKRALEKRRTQQKIQLLKQELNEKYKFENIVGGSSPVMSKILKLVTQVAVTDSTVLITGESGTGKELIAKAIHNHSYRKDEPMVTINCGSLPASILESELFGHVKGSFTGAIKDKKGLFQEADGGTLFLDEIGEIAPQIQASLLRFLEEGEIRRVGDNHVFRADVRLIAATNKDLEGEVERGNFREDLYYRLNVIPIHLPPLRERREDIPLLVEHFLKIYSQKLNKAAPVISPSAMTLLMDYHWPGNIRELRNFIERIIALNTNHRLDISDLQFNFSRSYRNISERLPRKTTVTLSEMEKSLILETLENCGGNQKLTAERLGISTTTLWRKLKGYGVAVEEFKEA